MYKKLGNTRCFALIAAVFLILAMPALAEEAGAINSGDTAWVLVSNICRYISPYPKMKTMKLEWKSFLRQ